VVVVVVVVEAARVYLAALAEVVATIIVTMEARETRLLFLRLKVTMGLLVEALVLPDVEEEHRPLAPLARPAQV